MGDVLETGQGQGDQEIIIERPDGARVVALVNIEAIKDSSGRLAGAVNVFREKPGQRPGGLHLNGRGRDSDAILQSLPVPVHKADAAGKTAFYNQAAAQIWGGRPGLAQSECCASWRTYWPGITSL